MRTPNENTLFYLYIWPFWTTTESNNVSYLKEIGINTPMLILIKPTLFFGLYLAICSLSEV